MAAGKRQRDHDVVLVHPSVVIPAHDSPPPLQDEDDHTIQHHLEQFIRMDGEAFYVQPSPQSQSQPAPAAFSTAPAAVLHAPAAPSTPTPAPGDSIPVVDPPPPAPTSAAPAKDYAPAEYWDASRLELTTYAELVARRDEVIDLLIEQGNIPELQAASDAAVTHALSTKQASWAILLRRCLMLYSVFCGQRGIPVYPVSPAKVALYLARMDLSLDAPGTSPKDDADDEEEEDDHPAVAAVAAAVRAQDLAVAPPTALDPVLAGHARAAASAFGPRGHSNGKPGPQRDVVIPHTTPGAKPKRVLKRKTLEQYVNRLTALRTPTLELWRPRTGGSAAAKELGLGQHPLVKDILERAGGESATDVKKRGRERRAAIKAEAEGEAGDDKARKRAKLAKPPTTTSTATATTTTLSSTATAGAATDKTDKKGKGKSVDLQVNGSDEHHHGPTLSLGPSQTPTLSLLDDGQYDDPLSPRPTFTVTSGPSTFLVSSSSSSLADHLPHFGVVPDGKTTGVGERYELAAPLFQMAFSYVLTLSGGAPGTAAASSSSSTLGSDGPPPDASGLAEIARSVEAFGEEARNHAGQALTIDPTLS